MPAVVVSVDAPVVVSVGVSEPPQDINDVVANRAAASIEAEILVCIVVILSFIGINYITSNEL